MPHNNSLQRDRVANPNQRIYHPYVNDPSFCQRLFEIACLVLILASVPAWLGGVYSIFVTGYGTALGLLGLLTFGTRRHTLMFLVMSILFFIFVIVVIILNAIDPIGKNLPFNDDTFYGGAAAAGSNNNNNNGTNNGNNKRSELFARQTCQYNNCNFDIYRLGQLDDGQLRLNFGSGASSVRFSLADGVVKDDLGRICYISSQSQMQCDFAPQTQEYNKYCIQNGRLTYAGSPVWYACYTGTGNNAANIYTSNLYGHCSTIFNLTSVNSTCGAGSEGVPSDVDPFAFAGNGGDLNNNGTNSTASNTTNGAFAAGGEFNGSRVYAYIDSGIILAATLLTIIAGLAIAREVRPAPGTLTHTSTTSTTSAPMAGYGGSAPAAGYGGATTGAPGYAVPAAGATGAAAPAGYAARSGTTGTTGTGYNGVTTSAADRAPPAYESGSAY